ncbi:hormogonium polysaccharide biosynthesis protein HpsL [Crocosphaera sp. UHCC 0190]|uniref:hormogonium polysaccharide biosynthesis protein HpsL n=1 Tax=Crocosphaera sp. UHCC 0190 TaxID=3110246 RepID=UPI002B21410F|nr:hormogonium polysaccharide biosynthesis protein HpsL [Crocosphaera sp. UHCC 0190]MEA5511464.1 hormogonium polysaccharide biosynthesis protein HpsL [Crocosphaera sp. UHCC 0190]
MVRSKSKRKATKGQKGTSVIDIKEKLAQKRQGREKRRKLMSLIGFSLFFAIIVGVTLSFSISPKVGISVGVLVPTMVICYNYPRTAMWAFLIYMPFSGTATYWIGGGNALFQISKDGFYIPALLGFITECRRKRKPIIVAKQLLPTLLLILTCSLLTLFLVNGLQHFLPTCDSLSDYEEFLRDANGNFILDSNGIIIRTPCRSGIPFLQGVIGLKVLLGYVPLIFCAYYLIEDKKKLLFFGRLLVVLAIICCLLGLAQYWMLKTGRCRGTDYLTGLKLFQPQLTAKCLVGGSLLYSPSQGQIRLPGTFVSPWHWAWFLIGNAAITFAVAFSDTSFFWRNTGLVGMALVFINAIVCGQRIALAMVPALIVILLFLTGQVANLKRFIPIGIGLAFVLFVGFSFINPDFIQERIDSFVARWNAAPPYVFMQDQFLYALDNQKGILGRGLGKATNSTRIFGSVSLVETYHPKLLFEIGFLGLGAFMIFVSHLSFLTFKAMKPLKDKALKSFASGFWVFILIISYFPYWYPLDTDPVCVYYWLFAGIILKLPLIDKEEQAKLKAQKDAEDAKKKRVKTTKKVPSAT